MIPGIAPASGLRYTCAALSKLNGLLRLTVLDLAPDRPGLSLPGALEFAGIASKINHWLLANAAQRPAEPYSGGVAGWLQPDGQPSFVYGEITGYWLTWLAGLAEPIDLVARHAAAAVDFLDRTWRGAAPPPTRLYIRAATPDWRNRALFAFDMAMILRGLSHVIGLIEPARCAAVAERIVPWIGRCIDVDGTLATHLLLDERLPLPDRWSTRSGPFQSKAAAALLHVPEEWLPAELIAASHLTIAKWRGSADRHDDLHPRLYALEGEILVGGEADRNLAGSCVPPSGRLAENARVPRAPVRADVLAQAIRILVLAEGDAVCAPQSRAANLAKALLPHVTPEGAVLFRRGAGPRNVWCAMFAAQAFAWLAACAAGQAIDRTTLV